MKTVEIHHFFTHDMRWEDNTALSRAILRAGSLHDTATIRIKGWICLDPKQISKLNTDTDRLDYRGVPGAITFLYACESLLQSNNPLGSIEVVLDSIQNVSKQLKKKNNSKSNVTHIIVSCARQYTPFAHQRQIALERDWDERFLCSDDHSLVSPKVLLQTTKKEQYIVFSPFYNFAKSLRHTWKPKKTVPVKYEERLAAPPRKFNKKQIKMIQSLCKPLCNEWKTLEVTVEGEKTKIERNILPTNRKEGLSIIESLAKRWKSNTYDTIRNDIQQETSMLARFLNSGVISIREVWKFLGRKMPAFERQLVWRSFYACRMNAIRNPKWKPNESLTIDEYDSPKWCSIEDYDDGWERWITGTTGVPIVDAAMRYLRKHGWLHNRLRMIVASYLTRILRISWRHGEAWFAQHLFDYDATQNHFGWKGQASLSRDSSEYFRVMNPWLQGKKYDKEAKFIKDNIPELNNVDATTIHTWETVYMNHPDVTYPPPLIPDHKQAAQSAREQWKQALHSD